MPTTPYASLLASVNGAGAVSGGVVIPASASIAFSFQDTTGWQSYTIEMLQPPGASVPAGWTDEGDGLVSYTGVTTPPAAITFPAITGWGKWICSIVVNGGTKNGEADHVDMTNDETALSMLSSTGLEDIAPRETTQFSALRSWAGALQTLLRTVHTFLNGTISALTVIWYPGGATTHPVLSTVREIQTTDATQSTLATYAHPASRMVKYTAIVTGYRPSNGDSFSQEHSVTYKRVVAGAPAIVGALTSTTAAADAGAAAWASTIDVDSNNIRVRVTGQASATINWSVELRAQERS